MKNSLRVCEEHQRRERGLSLYVYRSAKGQRGRRDRLLIQRHNPMLHITSIRTRDHGDETSVYLFDRKSASLMEVSVSSPKPVDAAIHKLRRERGHSMVLDL